MNDTVKQRLVGAVVLGCLAIIFIPMLLDGDGLSSPDLVIEVPIAPLIPAVPDNQPVRPDFAIEEEARLEAGESVLSDAETAGAGEGSEIAGEVESESVVTSLPEPGLDHEGLPVGWVVRMGAFGQRNNAEALESRLHGLDYKAFIRPVSTGQGTLAGVYVGPVISRADAESLKTELAESVDIQGVVTEFSLDE